MSARVIPMRDAKRRAARDEHALDSVTMVARQIDLVRGCAAAVFEQLHGSLYRERGVTIPRELRALAAGSA
jgi:hypothetical protein